MHRILAILEVSRKQDYIFSSKELAENIRRSQEISYVTSAAFFRSFAGLYNDEENMVYAGGGHVVLQFPDRASAAKLIQAATEQVQRLFDGMELFAKQMEYDETRSLSQNLNSLVQKLEEKKALRAASIRRVSFGVEELDKVSYQPAGKWIGEVPARPEINDSVRSPDGRLFPSSFEAICKSSKSEQKTGEENFIAVVHVDGNGMGQRVQALYGNLDRKGNWKEQCRQLAAFSLGIQKDFENAFSDVAEAVAKLYPNGVLPIRPVVLAGDDVCFVTRGDLGIECGRLFLESLSKKTNAVDGKPYTACAGVALVHLKYPFHEAYNLSEALCSSAKKFGAAYDPNGRICALDWHIEFGQMKDTLSALREDYITDDNCRLELRPVAVVHSEPVPKERTYMEFIKKIEFLNDNKKDLPRSKLKGMRNAMKQGEVETVFYAQKTGIRTAFDKYFDYETKPAQSRDLPEADRLLNNNPFFKDILESKSSSTQMVKRSLFFDAIEIQDHFDTLQEGK